MKITENVVHQIAKQAISEEGAGESAVSKNIKAFLEARADVFLQL